MSGAGIGYVAVEKNSDNNPVGMQRPEPCNEADRREGSTRILTVHTGAPSDAMCHIVSPFVLGNLSSDKSEVT
jgi:hypothetical protein